MIKQGDSGQVIKTTEGMSETVKYFLLNCLLIPHVDSNWFTLKAKLILRRMEKITYQTDSCIDTSENLHRVFKDPLIITI